MRLQIRFASCAFLFSLIALCCLPCLRAFAQSVATVHKFETEPHVGTPDEALVGIIVTNRAADGTVQIRHGNGVFIRCDGFILAPDALFGVGNTAGAQAGKRNQSVVVVLHPGTDLEKQVLARRPRESGILSVGDRFYRLTYAVLKMDDTHYPAPRLLSPDALAPGDALRVIYSPWSESTGKFLPPVSTAAAVGSKVPSASPALPNAASPTAPLPLFTAQMTRLSQALPTVSNGGVVIGPDNMVVGMVTEATATGASDFANLGSLDQATNSVGVLPPIMLFTALAKSGS